MKFAAFEWRERLEAKMGKRKRIQRKQWKMAKNPAAAEKVGLSKHVNLPTDVKFVY